MLILHRSLFARLWSLWVFRRILGVCWRLRELSPRVCATLIIILPRSLLARLWSLWVFLRILGVCWRLRELSPRGCVTLIIILPRSLLARARYLRVIYRGPSLERWRSGSVIFPSSATLEKPEQENEPKDTQC